MPEGHLVLSRKIGQSIYIGQSIRVKVTQIHGHVVRLAIQAPTEIPVHRAEVKRRIEEEEHYG